MDPKESEGLQDFLDFQEHQVFLDFLAKMGHQDLLVSLDAMGQREIVALMVLQAFRVRRVIPDPPVCLV